MSLTINLIGDSHLCPISSAGIAVAATLRCQTMRAGRHTFLIDAVDVIEGKIKSDVVLIMIDGNDVDQPYLDVREPAETFVVYRYFLKAC